MSVRDNSFRFDQAVTSLPIDPTILKNRLIEPPPVEQVRFVEHEEFEKMKEEIEKLRRELNELKANFKDFYAEYNCCGWYD